MVLIRCDRCQVQVSVAGTGMDFVHNCNSGIAALDNEDRLIVGVWDDYTGSDYTLRTTPASVQNQNLPNKLMGTRAWVESNAKTVPLTNRGANAQTYRTRQHQHYIGDINKMPSAPSDIDFQPVFNPDRNRKRNYENL